jgi:ketosteroid isomerase-like protein
VTGPEDAIHLRLVEQFGEAWDAGDVDKLMSLLTDDCVYSASVGPEPGTTYTGKEAVREGFLTMLAFDSGGESHTGRAFVAGNLAVCEWSYLFRAGSGTDFEIRGCDIFEFRSGRICRKDGFRKSFPTPCRVVDASNNVKPSDGD